MIRSNIELINEIKIGKRVKDNFFEKYDKEVLQTLKERYTRKMVIDAWNNETWEEFEDTFSLKETYNEYERSVTNVTINNEERINEALIAAEKRKAEKLLEE